jgi:hypothetical protein
LRKRKRAAARGSARITARIEIAKGLGIRNVPNLA